MERLYKINSDLFPNSTQNGSIKPEIKWGDDTKKVIDAKHFDFQDNDSSKVLIVKSENAPADECIFLVNNQKQACRLLDAAIDTNPQQGIVQFFSRVGMAASTYADVTNGRRNISRDLVISCIFLSHLLGIDAANHLLTELKCPGLFTDIAKPVKNAGVKNSRNYVLKCCLSWKNAIEAGKAPSILPKGCNYLGFLQMVLSELGLEPSVGPKTKLPIPSFENCSRPVKSLIADLSDKAAALRQSSAVPTNSLRRTILKEYQEKNGNPTLNRIYEECARATNISCDFTKDILSGKDRGGRVNLIYLYHHLGCDLNQVNQILRMADWPLLYPRSKGEDFGFFQLFSS